MYIDPTEGLMISKPEVLKFLSNTFSIKLDKSISFKSLRKKAIAKNRISRKKTIHIAVSSNKGGGGKTTLAVQLSWIFNLLGYKVLLVDFDAQANITCPLLLDDRETEAERSLYNVVTSDLSPSDITNEISEDFFFIGANSNLSNIDHHLQSKEESFKGNILSPSFNDDNPAKDIYVNFYNMFKKMGEPYDFVIYDTNPELNRNNRLSLQVCDLALFPIQAKESGAKSYNATLTDLNDSFITIDRSNTNIEKRLAAVFNELNPIPDKIKQDRIKKVFSFLNESILDTVIPFDYFLGEISDVSLPAIAHPEIETKTLEAIFNLANNVIARCEELDSFNDKSKRRHMFLGKMGG